MMHNEKYFYVGAYMQEPHIMGYLKEKNSVIYQENDFEVFIDPNGSSHQYTEFEINALNTIWGLLIINPYRDGYNIINPYPIDGLLSAVKINGALNNPSDIDKGWSVEIAFPWNILRQFATVSVPPKEGDIWRMNFSRVEWKYEIKDGKYEKIPNLPEDNWVWTPQYEINMHKPESFGFVEFSEKIKDNNDNNSVTKFPQERWEIQQILFWIYQCQNEYYKINKSYAKLYEDLGISDLSFDESVITKFKLNKIYLDDVFEYDATIIIQSTSEERDQIWHIRSDSKQWKTLKD